MKFGAIHVLELDTKRQELFDMTNKSHDLYNIYCKGRKIYSHLTEEEYFDIMDDLSIEYYQTGSPSPDEIYTEIVENYGKV